ncbi:MAG: UvrD-helicase domain-containing protein, partial [Bacteroidia bacterium]|nr:UvrD-helicase domain-containing protein [Bacteroidia bacterium]MDW8134665.1 UvrD-helicase domain-containing protein [Bacteroidia bacterium]
MSLRVILASAGSGKTHRLATLALEALEQPKCRGVLAITFTRNAAAELRERILRLAAEKSYSTLLRQIILGQAPLYTSTIDALVREIFYYTAPLLGIATYSTLIVEEEDQIEATALVAENLLMNLSQPKLMDSLRKKLQDEIEKSARRLSPTRILQSEIEAQINEGALRASIRFVLHEWAIQNASNAQGDAWLSVLNVSKADGALIKIIYEALRSYRQRTQKLFLRDLVVFVQLIAQYFPFLLSEKARFYTELFVDEAQDTSLGQWEIIKPLLEELRAQGGKVTLIGDPKQSIYAWREADFRVLLSYWRNADNPETLSQNFRSHPTIVGFNNQLYSCLPFLLEKRYKQARNKNPFALAAVEELKNLYHAPGVLQTPKAEASSNEGKQRVQILLVKEEQERGERIQEVLNDLRSTGIPPHEIAFLIRRNDEVAELFSLLPGLPMQLQAAPLGSCTSLAVTWRYMQAYGMIEEKYMCTLAGEGFTSLLSAIQEAAQKIDELLLPPLTKWENFYKIGCIWSEIQPSH